VNQARQFTLDFPHRPSFSGDDFLVAPANQAAIDWIDKWPEWPHHALAVSGPRGSGKTHLSHVFMSRSNAVPVELNPTDPIDIRSVIRDHSALVIDNANSVAGTAAEEHLFHLLNVIREENRTALLLSDTPPARWSVNLPDLQSRLNAIPHVAITAPDDALIAALVVKLFHDRQLRVDSAIVDYLLTRTDRSFEAIRVIVARIDEAALREHRNITIPLIRQVLDQGA